MLALKQFVHAGTSKWLFEVIKLVIFFGFNNKYMNLKAFLFIRLKAPQCLWPCAHRISFRLKHKLCLSRVRLVRIQSGWYAKA
jgi:hypothetical protein